jgi:hypothetical protein
MAFCAAVAGFSSFMGLLFTQDGAATAKTPADDWIDEKPSPGTRVGVTSRR